MPDEIDDILNTLPNARPSPRAKGLRPELESHWSSLKSELTKAGERPVIRSGFRTAAQQNALHRAGKPTKGNDGYINISPHQEGRALDLGNLTSRGRRIVRDYAKRTGLHVPGDEPWHIALPKSQVGQTPQGDPLDRVMADVPTTVGESDPLDDILADVPDATPANVNAPRLRQNRILKTVPVTRAQVAGAYAQRSAPNAIDIPGSNLSRVFKRTGDLPVNPKKIEVRPRGFQFNAPADDKLRADLRVEVANEVASATPQGRAPRLVNREIDAEVESRLRAIKEQQRLNVGAAQTGNAMSARSPGLLERVQTKIVPYTPGLQSIDTPMGIKTDLPRGVVRGLTLGALGDSREITPEEKIARPDAETRRNFAEGVGELSSGFVPYVAAGKAVSTIPRLARAGRGAAAARTGTTFGAVETARQGINTAKTSEPFDLSEVAISTAIGTAMGAIPGVNAGLKQRIFAAVAPQVAADAARGVPIEQAAQNALTNVLFEAAAGRKLGLSRQRIAELRADIESRQTVPSATQRGLDGRNESDQFRSERMEPDTRGILASGARTAETTSGEAGVGDQPASSVEQPQRYYHTQYGNVVKSPDQSGSRRGKTKVYVEGNPSEIHYVRSVSLQGRGNERMVPLKESAEQPAQAELITQPDTANKPLESSAGAVREVQPSLPKPVSTPSVTPEVSPAAREGDVEKSGTEGFDRPLSHLIQHPNKGIASIVLGNEKETARRDNAFTYTTRGTSKKTYPVDVVALESENGTRYIAKDGDLIVAGAFVDKNHNLTGVVTEGGMRKVGIGTNLVREIQKIDPAVKPSGVASQQGQRLLERLKQPSPQVEAAKPTTPSVSPNVREGISQAEIDAAMSGDKRALEALGPRMSREQYIDAWMRRNGFEQDAQGAWTVGTNTAPYTRQVSQREIDGARAEFGRIYDKVVAPSKPTTSESKPIQNQVDQSQGSPLMPKGWPDVRRGDTVYVDGKPVKVTGVGNDGRVEAGGENITGRYTKTPDAPLETREVDRETGLPLNEDGTVTLYHGTTEQGAAGLRQSGVIKSAGEPDIYLTTKSSGTGYGDRSVAVRVNPKDLILDDEFPDGRQDFRVPTRRGEYRPASVEVERAANAAKEPSAAKPEFNVIGYDTNIKAISDTEGNIYATIRAGKKRGGSQFFEVKGYSSREGKHPDLEGRFEARTEQEAIDSAMRIAEREAVPSEAAKAAQADGPAGMSLEDYRASLKGQRVERGAKGNRYYNREGKIQSDHKAAVEAAMRLGGKGVSPEALKPYPDIAAKYPSAAKEVLGESGETAGITRRALGGRFNPVLYEIGNSELQVITNNNGERSVASFTVPENMRNKGIGQSMLRRALDDGPIRMEAFAGTSDDALRVKRSLIRKGVAEEFSNSDGVRFIRASKSSVKGEANEPQVPLTEVKEPKLSVESKQAEGVVKSTPLAPELSTTSARKAQMSADRAGLDLPELPAPERKAWQKTLDEAKAKGIQNAGVLADEVLAKPRALNDVETGQLVLRAQEIKNEHSKVMQEIGAAKDADVISAKREQSDALQREFDRITEATKRSGTEKGRALASQKLTINQDFDLVSVLQRAKAAKGKELSSEERVKFEGMAKQIEELQTKLAKAEANALSKSIQKDIEKISRQRKRSESKQVLDDEFAFLKTEFAQARMESKGVQPSGLAGIDPEGKLTPIILKMARNRVKAGIVEAERVIDEVYSAVKEHVEGASKDDVRALLAGHDLERDPLPAIKTRLRKQEADLTRRIEEKDYSPPPKRKPVVYDREASNLKAQVEGLKRKIENEIRGTDSKIEVILAMRKAGMLTGIRTHARNIGGTGGFQAFEEAARMPGALADLITSTVTGRRALGAPNPVAVAKSSYEAATKGVTEAIQIMKHGTTAEEMAKVERHRELNSGSKIIDAYVNTVFRALSAEDKIFRTYAMKRSLEDQAKLRSRELGRTAKDLAENPTSEMVSQAILDAEVATFNNENKLATRLSPEGVIGKTAMDLILPFKRTPANIFARLIESSPLGLAKAGFRVLRGDVNKNMSFADQRSFSQTIGRSVTGSSLIALGYWLAGKGLATGLSEDDAGDREVQKASGRSPLSVKVGNNWHQIGAFSPIGNLIAIGAALHREQTKPLKEGQERGNALASAVPVGAKVMLEQPFLKGASGVVDAIQNPGTRGEAFIGQTVGSAAPTALSDLGSVIDNKRREGKGIVGRVQSRVPFLRSRLPEDVDVFARPLQSRRTSAIDPTLTARNIDDPFVRELVRLDIGVPKANKKPGESDSQVRTRRIDQGQAMAKELAKIVELPEYQKLSDEEKVKALKDAIERARKKVNAGNQRPARQERRARPLYRAVQ